MQQNIRCKIPRAEIACFLSLAFSRWKISICMCSWLYLDCCNSIYMSMNTQLTWPTKRCIYWFLSNIFYFVRPVKYLCFIFIIIVMQIAAHFMQWIWIHFENLSIQIYYNKQNKTKWIKKTRTVLLLPALIGVLWAKIISITNKVATVTTAHSFTHSLTNRWPTSFYFRPKQIAPKYIQTPNRSLSFSQQAQCKNFIFSFNFIWNWKVSQQIKWIPISYN